MNIKRSFLFQGVMAGFLALSVLKSPAEEIRSPDNYLYLTVLLPAPVDPALFTNYCRQISKVPRLEMIPSAISPLEKNPEAGVVHVNFAFKVTSPDTQALAKANAPVKTAGRPQEKAETPTPAKTEMMTAANLRADDKTEESGGTPSQKVKENPPPPREKNITYYYKFSDDK